MTNLLRTLLVLVIVCLTAPAFADPYDDTFNRGTELFKDKKYAKARDEYLRAYDIRKDPSALFAIAQTYRYEGNFKEAIDWYKKFLADSQATQDLVTEAKAYLTDSETRQKAIDDATRKPPPDDNKVEPVKPPPQTDVVRSRRIPLGSKIAAGVTGAGLISALVFTKLGLGAENDLKDKGANATQKDADKVERFQNLINISWGVTGAAALTAVVIYFAAPSYSTDRRTVVVAPMRDGGWTAAFTTRF